MTLKEALIYSRDTLANNTADAPLESEVLLRHLLEIDRTRLYLDLDKELSAEQEEDFRKLVERRLKGEPVAYITTRREFYGLDFYVDKRVLIPRPETELLVEKALEISRNRHLNAIAEIGTGCGAIAVSLALNLPVTKIYATDISADALEVARLNCLKHGVANRISLLKGDLLSPLPEAADLIVANLPYVEESKLPQDEFEPATALNGGADGLRYIKKLCCQLDSKLRPDGYLLLEIGQGQAENLTAFLANLFPDSEIEVTADLGGIDRVISLKHAHIKANLSLSTG